MQADKAGWGGAHAAPESWAEFDAMPAVLKAVFWYAPYSYAASPQIEALKRGEDPRAIATATGRAMAGDRLREVRRIYGRAHPQAGA